MLAKKKQSYKHFSKLIYLSLMNNDLNGWKKLLRQNYEVLKDEIKNFRIVAKKCIVFIHLYSKG